MGSKCFDPIQFMFNKLLLIISFDLHFDPIIYQIFHLRRWTKIFIRKMNSMNTYIERIEWTHSVERVFLREHFSLAQSVFKF